jgi:hypothetical protein
MKKCMNKIWWQQANKQPTKGGIRYIIIKYVVTMGKMASTNIHEDYDQHPRQVHYVQISWAKGICATKTSMEKLVEGMQELLPSFQTRFLLLKSPSYHPLTTTCFLIQLVNNQSGKQPFDIYSYFFLCSLFMECQSWHSLLINFSFVFHSQKGIPLLFLMDVPMNLLVLTLQPWSIFFMKNPNITIVGLGGFMFLI